MTKEKNEFSGFSWRIYDFFDFIEKHIFPWVISCLIFVAITTTIWAFWPDFTDRDTVYSYQINVEECSSKNCEHTFPEPQKYVIDKHNKTVSFEAKPYGFHSYENCTILDKKNWSCDFPLKNYPPFKMKEGIIEITESHRYVIEKDKVKIKHVSKWKWKLEKIQNFLRKLPKI